MEIVGWWLFVSALVFMVSCIDDRFPPVPFWERIKESLGSPIFLAMGLLILTIIALEDLFTKQPEKG